MCNLHQCEVIIAKDINVIDNTASQNTLLACSSVEFPTLPTRIYLSFKIPTSVCKPIASSSILLNLWFGLNCPCLFSFVPLMWSCLMMVEVVVFAAIAWIFLSYLIFSLIDLHLGLYDHNHPWGMSFFPSLPSVSKILFLVSCIWISFL